MEKWSLDEVKDWIRNRCQDKPAGRPGGAGIVINPADIPDEKTDWDTVCRVTKALIKSNTIDATPGYTYESKGGVAFWQFVKLT